jgi:hypothetical protein
VDFTGALQELIKRQDEAIAAKDRQLAEQATISETQRTRIAELIVMDQMRRAELT